MPERHSADLAHSDAIDPPSGHHEEKDAQGNITIGDDTSRGIQLSVGKVSKCRANPDVDDKFPDCENGGKAELPEFDLWNNSKEGVLDAEGDRTEADQEDNLHGG